MKLEVGTENQFVKDYLAHFDGAWQRASNLDSLNLDPEGTRSRRNKDRGRQAEVANAPK